MIKVHHLNYSRSTRILWLMEELGLPYEIVPYSRDPKTYRAPDSLKGIHPLGKAPVIEDGDLVLAESGAIVEYLVARHGGGRLAPAADTPEWAAYIEWLHYAEGSAMLPIMIHLMGALTGGNGGLGAFAAPEIRHALAYIAGAVQPTGYLLAAFSAADVQMFYVIEAARMGGLLTDFPALTAYLERLETRPAFQAALDKGGPVALPVGRG